MSGTLMRPALSTAHSMIAGVVRKTAVEDEL